MKTKLIGIIVIVCLMGLNLYAAEKPNMIVANQAAALAEQGTGIVEATQNPIAKLINDANYVALDEGFYVLTRDIVSENGHGIAVPADAASIDLQGHKIAATENATIKYSFAAGVSATSKELTVKNGTIEGFDVAISNLGVNSKVHLVNVTFRDNRLDLYVDNTLVLLDQTDPVNIQPENGSKVYKVAQKKDENHAPIMAAVLNQ